MDENEKLIDELVDARLSWANLAGIGLPPIVVIEAEQRFNAARAALLAALRPAPADLARLVELEAAIPPAPWDAPLKNLGDVAQPFDTGEFYFSETYEAYPPLGESGPCLLAPSKENAEFLVALRNAAPALLRELAALRQRVEDERWVSVEERLPKEVVDNSGISETVMVLFYGGSKYAAYEIAWFDYNEGEWVNEDHTFEGITHWYPLPPPPDAEQKERGDDGTVYA